MYVQNCIQGYVKFSFLEMLFTIILMTYKYPLFYLYLGSGITLSYQGNWGHTLNVSSTEQMNRVTRVGERPPPCTSTYPRLRPFSYRPGKRPRHETLPGVVTDPQRVLGTSGSSVHNLSRENRNGRYLLNL